MLDDKIVSLKNYFANDITRIISEEISKFMIGLKSETMESTKTHDPFKENTSTIISEINNKICTLESENKKLKDEILELKNVYKLPNIENNIYESKLNDTRNNKKIVIYGLNEYHSETEEYLHYRISTMIQEICGINITGYVEEITRIGRKGHRRPVVVEFLSKRLPKHLLQNHQLFQNTGISISEYLDKETFLKRKKLSQILTEARRNGHHAVIRNNKLLIDGKEVNKSQKENLYTSYNNETLLYNNSEYYSTNVNNRTIIHSSQSDNKQLPNYNSRPYNHVDHSFREQF
ncbi:hypothetical protein HF086_004176 [Spodoptera exigua]|uniref:Endonuclease-reverse transcriptase n=1 Tax=Spodoptera exigua TaxID=7107 RepID=A0A922SII4_SPOEX|nr:hypothetical protein HF086_004176 [Spodoptera exigua]